MKLVLIRQTGWHNVRLRLTAGRGSPDLTQGRHRIRTSSARSTWFHGGPAGWTGCAGTGNLEGENGRNAKRSGHVYAPADICHLRKSPVRSLLPLRESPLLHTPSLKFFLTTFFTSSSAWGSSGVLKHVRWEPPEEHCCHNVHMSKEKTAKKTTYSQFTWKKLSSISLRIPSLSKSDTLKIRVRAFTQSVLI